MILVVVAAILACFAAGFIDEYIFSKQRQLGGQGSSKRILNPGKPLPHDISSPTG